MSDDHLTETGEDPGQWYLNTDIAGGLAIGIFGLVGLLGAEEGAFNVWVFPEFNSIIILLMAVAMVIEGLVRKKREAVISKVNARRLVIPMAIGLVLFFFLFTRLGWIATVTLLFGLSMFMLRSRRDWRTAASSFLLAGGAALFFYYVFGNVFYVPWPEGSWFEALLGG